MIGVGTKIDPTACRADRLVGQILGEIGTLPNIYVEITISYDPSRHLFGVPNDPSKKNRKVCF